MPRVSIIPTHNRAALLERAIESARMAGSDLEVIVADDASSDETPKLCAGLEGIRYLPLTVNRGLAGARDASLRPLRTMASGRVPWLLVAQR